MPERCFRGPDYSATGFYAASAHIINEYANARPDLEVINDLG